MTWFSKKTKLEVKSVHKFTGYEFCSIPDCYAKESRLNSIKCPQPVGMSAEDILKEPENEWRKDRERFIREDLSVEDLIARWTGRMP